MGAAYPAGTGTMRRNSALWMVGIIVVLIVAFGVAGLSGRFGGNSADSPASGHPSQSNPTSTTSPSPSPQPPAGKHTALAQLATLPVKGKSPLTGYARVADFGRAWLDVDHNGCDTRNDILARDMTHVTRSGGCRIMSGVLREPYTGKIIDFLRGVKTSALVQIDHLVPLANAWQTGAQKLTQSQRELLGNDPLELLAVDGSSNEQKGDGDAATWLPAQKGFRCSYVSRQIAVKAKYHLWVTPAERAAMVRVLSKCPTFPAAR